MTAIAQAGLSDEEFLERYDGQHVEWVDREVVPMSPVSDRHQDVAGFLLALVRFYAEARGLGEVRRGPYQMKPGPALPGRAPDIFFIAASHAGRLRKTFLDGPADLVVEIISPESRARDRGDKFYEYEAGGVPEYWLLDPVREQAEFYQAGDDGFYRPALPDAGGRSHSRALPGLWLDVSWLWQTPLPPLLSVLKQWGLV
jgi:Uma2 family endonuclease